MRKSGRRRNNRYQPQDNGIDEVKWDPLELVVTSTVKMEFKTEQPEHVELKQQSNHPTLTIVRRVFPPPCLNPHYWKRFDLTKSDIERISRDTMVTTSTPKYQMCAALHPTGAPHQVCPSAVQPNVDKMKQKYASCSPFLPILFNFCNQHLHWQPSSRPTKLATAITFRHPLQPVLQVEQDTFDTLYNAAPEDDNMYHTLTQNNFATQTFTFKNTTMIPVQKHPNWVFLQRVITTKQWFDLGEDVLPECVPVIGPIVVYIEKVPHVILQEGCFVSTHPEKLQKKQKAT